MTCLLSLGLAEAGERVVPEPNSAVDIVVGEQHAHHDSGVEHDSAGDTEHCPNCCHAPCFWLVGGDYRLSAHIESLPIRAWLAPRFTSERPPSLYRPPIA